MAKVPPPRGKGEPPPASGTLGNLDKPEIEALVSLNFKVPRAFRHEFRMYAANRDMALIEVLRAAFNALKDESTK